MPPRTFTLVILAALLAFGSPASAKEKKKPAKQAARTWKTVVEYVFKNGTDWPIKAPSSRTLGYGSDEVLAKGLSIADDKSKDGKEHSVCITYEIDAKGVQRPKEIDLGTMLVKETSGQKEIEAFRMRMSLDGTLLGAMHATGIVGHVKQLALMPDSKEIRAVFNSERDLYLKQIELAQLQP
ncbi:MAG: hypothetical protein PHS14_15980 [Elusimicrobia bacterium]|nr:hypothetical protein [Elusimicrobiota bacterium]